jgi:hypothetical protein
MIRACSLLGMTGGFLCISPALRGSLSSGLTQAAVELDKYSPYSYAGVALALLCCLMLAFYKASAPR